MMKKKFIFFIQPKSVVSLTFISFLAFSGLFIPPYSNLEKAEDTLSLTPCRLAFYTLCIFYLLSMYFLHYF